MKKLLAVLAIAVLSTVAFAEDAPQMPVSKAEQGAAMHSVACPSPCDFEIKSRDEKELVSIVKSHAKKFHKMTVSNKQIKDMMKPVN